MDFTAFMNSDLWAWGILPLLIFLARILDVSMGTIRVIFITRGYKVIAPIIGFFEVLIWLAAVQQIFNHLTNPIGYIAYAGGFATGTYVGMVLEEKLSMGKVIIRLIAKHKVQQLINTLKDAGVVVTSIPAEGSHGDVRIIWTVVNRQDIPHVVAIINHYNPRAFYTIEDVRYATERFMGAPKKKMTRFGFYRKGK